MSKSKLLNMPVSESVPKSEYLWARWILFKKAEFQSWSSKLKLSTCVCSLSKNIWPWITRTLIIYLVEIMDLNIQWILFMIWSDIFCQTLMSQTFELWDLKIFLKQKELVERISDGELRLSWNRTEWRFCCQLWSILQKSYPHDQHILFIIIEIIYH